MVVKDQASGLVPTLFIPSPTWLTVEQLHNQAVKAPVLPQHFIGSSQTGGTLGKPI